MRYLPLVVLGTAATMVSSGSPSQKDSRSVVSGPAPLVSDDREPIAAESRSVGTESRSVRWVRVTAPGLGTMRAAVAHPEGVGPFPAVLLLHGSHGFSWEYVRLAESLARNGILAVAPCWFSGGGGAGSRFITPIACAEAPSRSDASATLRAVGVLVQATQSLPGARLGRIGLVGHSRGAAASLNYLLAGGVAQAVILDSGAYPDEFVARASQFRVPILILHGTADSPADGGAATTDVQKARDFEQAMRREGQVFVEAHYYNGGGHNGIFVSAAQYDDEVRRMASFLHRNLIE